MARSVLRGSNTCAGTCADEVTCAVWRDVQQVWRECIPACRRRTTAEVAARRGVCSGPSTTVNLLGTQTVTILACYSRAKRSCGSVASSVCRRAAAQASVALVLLFDDDGTGL